MAVLCFGEILWDIFEDGEHIGGASYNVAAHLSKLGLPTYIYSRLGNDRLGKNALDAIQGHGVKTEFIQTDPQHPTGTAGVVLDDKAVPTFTIADNTAYDFIEAADGDMQKINDMAFDLFYFGTVAQKGETSRASLRRILSECQFQDVFFDINIRKPFYSEEIIATSLSHATILKINDGELVLLGKMFFGVTEEAAVISALFQKYEKLHTILVTKGPDGATVHTRTEAISMNYCVSKAVDTVGAGDAFSAGFISAYLGGMAIADAAKRGNILADYVASQKGAIPDYTPGQIRHHNVLFNYDNMETCPMLKRFSPLENKNGFQGVSSAPNFTMTVMGEDYGNQEGVSVGGSSIPYACTLKAQKIDGSGMHFTYSHEALALEIEVHMAFIPGCNVIRQTNTVRNCGEKEIVLTHLSSMHVSGIATDGQRPWNDDGKIQIHFCRNSWQGEGQWISQTLYEAGIHDCSFVHQNCGTFSVANTGTWSTAKFYPGAMIEDTETHQIWYFQIETSSPWHYEIGLHRWGDASPGELYMEADGADENTAGWAKTLAPGESFATVPVAFGCTNGGMEEAIRELDTYRRSTLKPVKAWEKEYPIVFNDYMNCLWANPTAEKLRPLVDAAAEAGAEVFCIDAGWFGATTQSWSGFLGDWQPSPDRFGESGLQGVLDYIQEKGMRPGLWLEPEACSSASEFYRKPDDHFLCRHGKRIGGSRAMLDFRHPAVRAHLHARIDALMAMGVKYFKIDYNQTAALGDDKYTLSAADGLLEHMRAVYSFWDEVREKHPDLTIESCSAGGMRGDYGIASHFHVQNVSDQEQYWRYVSNIQGALCNLLPEQTAIWSYPYPLIAANWRTPEVLATPEYRATMADGEETIFNMINAFCGTMLLSGHIDYADAYNKKLIADGCRLYKQIRPSTHNAFPLFPLPQLKMGLAGITATGLQDLAAGKIYLAVWRVDAPEAEVTIPLKKYGVTGAQMIYPVEEAENNGLTWRFDASAAELHLHFTKPRQARFFLLEV